MILLNCCRWATRLASHIDMQTNDMNSNSDSGSSEEEEVSYDFGNEEELLPKSMSRREDAVVRAAQQKSQREKAQKQRLSLHQKRAAVERAQREKSRQQLQKRQTQDWRRRQLQEAEEAAEVKVQERRTFRTSC